MKDGRLLMLHCWSGEGLLPSTICGSLRVEGGPELSVCLFPRQRDGSNLLLRSRPLNQDVDAGCCCDTAINSAQRHNILFPTMPWLWCFVFFSDLQVRSATPATSQTETYQLGLGFWWGAKHVEHQKYVPHCQATSLFKKTDHKCVQDSCFLCI